jgi:hypothetical protein
MPEDKSVDQKVKVLEQRLAIYEQNGLAKLYYALNRKMNEMADMLNSNSLSGINIDDPKDKSFDRIFKLLEKSETVASSAKVLGGIAGVTGDEDKDVAKKPFIETVATRRD